MDPMGIAERTGANPGTIGLPIVAAVPRDPEEPITVAG